MSTRLFLQKHRISFKPFLTDFKRINVRDFLSACLLLLLLRVVDLFITYKLTPDLSMEINPIISLFGGNWQTLLLSQLILILFIYTCMYFYFSNQKSISVNRANLSYPDFIHYYFFGTLNPWPQRLFSAPTDIKRHLIFDGFLLMSLSIMISTFAIIHNLLILYEIESYTTFVVNHSKLYLLGAASCMLAASSQLFFIKEFIKYRKNHNPENSRVNRTFTFPYFRSQT